jgi:hypothetical protein
MQPHLRAVVGKHAYPVKSWHQVSMAYVQTIKKLNARPETTPPCTIVDNVETILATVTRDGRIWRRDGSLMYDPQNHVETV